MAKTTNQPATASSTDLSDLDQRISELTSQVKERFGTLKHEALTIQRELERLSQQHERLTGKALLAAASNGVERGGKSAGATPAKTRGRKRTRKASPSVEWLQETLSKKGMSVRQIQEAAEEAGLSGLRIPAILKENKGKFKSEPGERKPGVKGIPAAVWGVK